MRHLLSLFTTGLLLGAASLLCQACGDDDKNGSVEFAGGGFTVSRTEVALLNDLPQSVTVRASKKPAVAADAQWVILSDVTPTGATGLYSFTISAQANTAYDERTAMVTVTAGTDKADIKVTQFGAETIKLTTTDGTLDPNGGTFTLKYQTTSELRITAPSWMTRVNSKSLTDGEASFTYPANFTGADRTGDFLLELASSPSITAQLAVVQASLPPTQDMPSNAVELAKQMYAGINIGNTLECPGNEGAWSGAKVNITYVRALKALGFNAVRIPCAWDSHISDRATNTIDPAWLDRVDEVVGMIVGEGMYAVLNIHWDGGWLEESVPNGYNADVDKKQRDYWTQIANKLNHFDEHLLFAGMNEPGVQNTGSVGKKAIEAINTYQQTFLNAVRETGGNNAKRVLVMQAPYTNIDEAMKADWWKMPTDIIPDRMMCEVHFYDPYQFNMMEEDASWGKMAYYWGAPNHVAGSDRNSTWGEEDHVRNQFKKIHDKFAVNGIPTVLGEYCVCAWRQNYKDIDVAKWWDSRNYWSEVVTREAKNYGLIPFYWETNGDINRTDGKTKNNVFDFVMRGAAESHYPW